MFGDYLPRIPTITMVLSIDLPSLLIVSVFCALTTSQEKVITNILEKMKPHMSSQLLRLCLKIFGTIFINGDRKRGPSSTFQPPGGVYTGGLDMKTVTLGIASRSESNKRFLSALAGKHRGEFISFTTPALLFKTLSAKRWELLKAMTGGGPMSIREVARRLDRDVKAVHRDVHILLDVGILQKTQKGRIEFPYDAVQVDFLLRAA